MRSTCAVILVLLSTAVFAQTPPAEDRFYQAIRQNDLDMLRTLIRDEGVEARDRQGQTPLLLATAFGSAEAVRLLVASGAEVKAATSGGVTALHLAATDPGKTRLLLEGGAEVNAVSQLGRTPLIVAASANGGLESVRLLLAKQANVHAADAVGITPLLAASIVDASESAKLLLAHGANPNTASKLPVATALMAAAANGNADLVRALLAYRPDVNAVSTDSATTVKNGPVQFGRVSALHLATLSGVPDVVDLLLAANAVVDPRDVRGMTPLMMAIATDRPDLRIARRLLVAGADPTLRSNAGESSIDWARKFGHPGVLAALKAAPLAQTPFPTAGDVRRPVAAHAPASRAAVARSLPLLRAASGRMLTDGGCTACHAQPLTGLAVHLAHARGWTTESAQGETARLQTVLAAASPQLMQLREGGGLPDALVYMTFLLAAEGAMPTRATDGLLHYLAAKQRANGSWAGVGGTRAPMQDGDLSRTALSIRAMTAYATPARAAEYGGRVRRAAAWLSAQTPVSTEDRVMQLLGLHWAGVDAKTQRARAQALLATQRADGGWAQTPYLASDAYATGQGLYALREVGVPASDPAMQRGIAFLLRTQEEDGSWHVKSRAMKVQPYFDSGFPHGHDQWISHAGTAWATMALAAGAQ
jgi:ankyrin repeat protein